MPSVVILERCAETQSSRIPNRHHCWPDNWLEQQFRPLWYCTFSTHPYFRQQCGRVYIALSFSWLIQKILGSLSFTAAERRCREPKIGRCDGSPLSLVALPRVCALCLDSLGSALGYCSHDSNVRIGYFVAIKLNCSIFMMDDSTERADVAQLVGKMRVSIRFVFYMNPCKLCSGDLVFS